MLLWPHFKSIRCFIPRSYTVWNHPSHDHDSPCKSEMCALNNWCLFINHQSNTAVRVRRWVKPTNNVLSLDKLDCTSKLCAYLSESIEKVFKCMADIYFKQLNETFYLLKYSQHAPKYNLITVQLQVWYIRYLIVNAYFYYCYN